MHERFDMERTFRNFANEFEACTTRVEHDKVMRRFLSAIFTLAGKSHWAIEGGSPDTMREMSRIITVFREHDTERT